MDRYITGNNINLRDVEIKDASFILSLRTDDVKSRFLNYTDANIHKQIEYIKKYKSKKDEYYFIIESKKLNPVGTIRIYDIQKERDSFCWGSWLIQDNVDITVALESAIMIYDFGFFTLNFNNCHIDVRKENSKVLNFHRLFGVKQTAEDDENYYYSYSKTDYILFRERLKI